MANFIQQGTPVPPAPPAAPAAPAQNQSDFRAEIRNLANELKNAARERKDLERQLERSSGAEAAQIRAQIAENQAQMRALEAQISEQAERFAQSFAGVGTAVTLQPTAIHRSFVSPGAVNDIFMIACVAIIGVFTVALARRLWRTPQRAVSAADGALVPSARLDRLEQAMDAMSIEIERIAEGQRFVTKLLTERSARGAETSASERA